MLVVGRMRGGIETDVASMVWGIKMAGVAVVGSGKWVGRGGLMVVVLVMTLHIVLQMRIMMMAGVQLLLLRVMILMLRWLLLLLLLLLLQILMLHSHCCSRPQPLVCA